MEMDEMSKEEREERECDIAAEYALEAFWDNASEQEQREFKRRQKVTCRTM